MESLLWLIILTVLVFAIVFLVVAPLNDGHGRKQGSSTVYCHREPGFFRVKRCGAHDFEMNGERNPVIHLQRGKQYIFWMCDDDDDDDDCGDVRERFSFYPRTTSYCDDDRHLGDIATRYCGRRDFLTVCCDEHCPPQFCYGTRAHPETGQVYLFD